MQEDGDTDSICYGLRFSCSLLKNLILKDKCWVKGKIALLRKQTILGRRWTHVPKNQLPVVDQWARDFKGEFQACTGCGGLNAEQHSHLWQSSWNWSFGGLISIILIVLSTFNLQLQGQFVPISLRPVLGIVTAYVIAAFWSSCC